MKVFLQFLIFVSYLTAWSHPCPEYIQQNKKALQALEFFKRWPQQMQIGSCSVEFFTCSGWAATTSNSPIAEVFIRDSKGREAYVSVQVPQDESYYFKTKTLVQKKMLHFEKIDRFYEEEFGRTEAARLELTTAWDDPLKLKHIELGLYSTNHQLQGDDGNKSEWFQCSQKD